MFDSTLELIAFAFSLALAVAAALLITASRDRKPVAPDRYQPPEGFGPVEAGYLLDGQVSNQDILSLIPYWAEKGYVAIENDYGFFRIRKRKDLESFAPEHERFLFHKMFLFGSLANAEDFFRWFGPDLKKARRIAAREFGRERPAFTAGTGVLRAVFLALTPLPVLSALYLSLSRPMGGTPALPASLLLGFVLLYPLYSVVDLIGCWRGVPFHVRRGRLVSLVAVFLVFVAGYFVYAVHTASLAVPIAAVLGTVLCALAAALYRRRTEISYDLLCQVEGLHAAILNDSDGLIEAADADKRYFYRILPYAYVFGLCDRWAERFKERHVEKPKWFVGCSTISSFSPEDFALEFAQAMTAFSFYMLSEGINRLSGMPNKNGEMNR